MKPPVCQGCQAPETYGPSESVPRDSVDCSEEALIGLLIFCPQCERWHETRTCDEHAPALLSAMSEWLEDLP